MGKLLALALLLAGCSYSFVSGEGNTVTQIRAPEIEVMHERPDDADRDPARRQ
jgi:hypothetical protein